jgi:hypothetical protein
MINDQGPRDVIFKNCTLKNNKMKYNVDFIWTWTKSWGDMIPQERGLKWVFEGKSIFLESSAIFLNQLSNYPF